jgi:hypothetical protein
MIIVYGSGSVTMRRRYLLIGSSCQRTAPVEPEPSIEKDLDKFLSDQDDEQRSDSHMKNPIDQALETSNPRR